MSGRLNCRVTHNYSASYSEFTNQWILGVPTLSNIVYDGASAGFIDAMAISAVQKPAKDGLSRFPGTIYTCCGVDVANNY